MVGQWVLGKTSSLALDDFQNSSGDDDDGGEDEEDWTTSILNAGRETSVLRF